MGDDAVSGPAGRGRIEDERVGHGTSDGYSDSGVMGQALVAAARVYPVPPACVAVLLVAGVVLGAVGDALLRASGPPGLNLSLWVASVAVAALALYRRAALALDRGRVAWLVIGVVFAAGLTWRDAPPLKLLALGCATLSFALAAHRLAASWVSRSRSGRWHPASRRSRCCSSSTRMRSSRAQMWGAWRRPTRQSDSTSRTRRR
jgi:hypothetical protein